MASASSSSSAGSATPVQYHPTTQKILKPDDPEKQLTPVVSHALSGPSKDAEKSTSLSSRLFQRLVPGRKSSSSKDASPMPACSSSESSTPTGLQRAESPLDDVMNKLEALAVVRIDLKKLQNKPNVSKEMEELRPKLLEKNKAEIVALRKAYIAATGAKVSGVVELMANLTEDQKDHLKLNEISGLAKAVAEEQTPSTKEQYESHRLLIEAFDQYQSERFNFTNLAKLFINESQKPGTPFFQNEESGGTGKVLSFGIKGNDGKTEHKFFVFKPTKESLGGVGFMPKFHESTDADLNKLCENTIKELREEAENYHVGGNPNSFNLVQLVQDHNIQTLEKFKAEYPPEFFKELTPKETDALYRAVEPYVLQCKYPGLPLITLNLAKETPQATIQAVVNSFKDSEKTELERKRNETQDPDSSLNKIYQAQLLVLKDIYGGPEAVAVNHVVRANLPELGGQHPLSTLANFSPWGDGLLMEFCQNKGSLEDAIANGESVTALLENATDEVKNIVCNQFILDVLLGEGDDNVGNCLITSKTEDGRISGLVNIDLTLSMPKMGKLADGSSFPVSPSFYRNCNFLNFDNPFIGERIDEIDAILPSVIANIKQQYQEYGSKLTHLQINAMVARWEMLKAARKIKLAPPLFQELTVGSGIFKKLEQLKVKDFSNPKDLKLIQKGVMKWVSEIDASEKRIAKMRESKDSWNIEMERVKKMSKTRGL